MKIINGFINDFYFIFNKNKNINFKNILSSLSIKKEVYILKNYILYFYHEKSLYNNIIKIIIIVFKIPKINNNTSKKTILN